MEANKKRLIIWGVIASVLVLTLIYAFSPRAIRVDLVEVNRSALEVSISDEGKTRVKDVFVLSAPVTGRARRVLLDVGDPIQEQLTVITEIEPSDPEFLDTRTQAQAEAELNAAQSSLNLARTQLEQARAELDFATIERQRAQKLALSNMISGQALDEAERRFRSRSAAFDTAQAAIQVKSFELDRARAAMTSPDQDRRPDEECACVPVLAPVSGSLLQIFHESEGVVAAGTPLAAIGDPASLEVVVDLLSADAVKVRSGQQVRIDEWGGDTSLLGVVRRVEPFGFTRVSSLGIEEQRVNVVIDFDGSSERRANLGHGYRVLARIITGNEENVLTIPLTALVREGDDWSVFEVQRGRAQLVPVTLGARNSLDAVVIEGLSESATLIRYPSDRIESGVRVRARDR